MKISIKNVGCLKQVEFTAGNITVISGQNSTGKSTILKALYTVLVCPSDFELVKKNQIDETLDLLMFRHSDKDHDLLLEGVDESKYRDIIDFLLKHIDDGDKQDKQSLEYTLDLKEGKVDDDFYQRIVRSRINSEFESVSQFRNVDSEKVASVNISGGPSMNCRVGTDGEILCKGNRRRIPRVVYFDSPFNVDDSLIWTIRRNNHRTDVWRLLNMDSGNIIMKGTYYSNVEKLDKVMDESIPGVFINTKNGLRYRSPNGYLLSPRNVAAGIKVFGTIRKLVDNGQLYEGSILLLDEPEVHLHPQWINVLGNILVILARDLNIRIIMTTHSPQLLMSVEANSRGDDDLARYYHLSYGDSGEVIMKDVSGNLNSVYQEMSDPIQETASRFW